MATRLGRQEPRNIGWQRWCYAASAVQAAGGLPPNLQPVELVYTAQKDGSRVAAASGSQLLRFPNLNGADLYREGLSALAKK